MIPSLCLLRLKLFVIVALVDLAIDLLYLRLVAVETYYSIAAVVVFVAAAMVAMATMVVCPSSRAGWQRARLPEMVLTSFDPT